MIVSTADLASYRGQVVMTDGCFDPIHVGHVEYLRAASELGPPLLCNVSGDAYLSGKHAPLLPEDQRVRVIDAIRYVAYTHLSSDTTASVLAELRPKLYAKGSDWRDRLPADEMAACERHGIEIVFLDTVLDSSTRLLADWQSKKGAVA